MSTQPIESCYVSTATSLQRPDADFGLAKVICLDLARQVDTIRSVLSDSTHLADSQSELITRLRADNTRLRDQLAEVQRLADHRANALAGLLEQHPAVTLVQDTVPLPRDRLQHIHDLILAGSPYTAQRELRELLEAGQ